MELTTIKTLQATGNTGTNNKGEKDKAGQASDVFAAMLQTATMRFGGKDTLPNAGQALSAKFDRPAEAPEPERRAAPETTDRAERPDEEERVETRPTDSAEAPRERTTDRDDGRDQTARESAEPRGENRAAETTNDGDQGARREQADTSASDTGADQSAATQAADAANAADAAQPAAQTTQADTAATANASTTVVQADSAQMQLAGAQQLAQTIGQTQQAAAKTTDKPAETAEVKVDPAAVEAAAGEQVEAQDTPFETGMAKRKSVNAAAQNNANQPQQAERLSGERSQLADQQAEDLARLIGSADKIKISVDNAANGRALTSTPTTGLVQGAILADEAFGEGLGQTDLGPSALNSAGVQKVGQGQSGPGNQNAGGQNPQAQANMAQQGLTNGGAQNAQNADAARGQAFSQMLNSGAGAQGEAAKAATQMAQTTAGTETTPQAGAGQINGPANTQATAQTQTAHQPAKPQYVPPQEVIDQIKVKISKDAAQGNETIKIQLRPEHLGKIEVKLELANDGKVQAHIVADNRETLDLLKQDARGMEKALQDAGLKTDAGSLSFAHREDNQRTLAREEDGRRGRGQGGETANAEAEAAEGPRGLAQVQSYQGIRPDGRVDYYI